MHHSIDRHPPHWLVLNIFILLKKVTHFDIQEAFKIQHLMLGIFPFYKCVTFLQISTGVLVSKHVIAQQLELAMFSSCISLPLFSFVPSAIVLFTVSLNYPFIFKFTIPFSSEAELINFRKKRNDFGLF